MDQKSVVKTWKNFILFLIHIGPAIIAQRLMFAAAAAAAAIPKEISSPENSSPAEKCSKDEMSSQEITNTSTPVEAEAVAQAFLKSVDKYFEVNEFGQENNDDKKFGTGTAFAKDELSDIIGKNEFKISWI